MSGRMQCALWTWFVLDYISRHWRMNRDVGICIKTLAYVSRHWHMYRDIGICFDTLVYVSRRWYIHRDIGVRIETLVFVSRDWYLYRDVGICIEKFAYVSRLWRMYLDIGICIETLARARCHNRPVLIVTCSTAHLNECVSTLAFHECEMSCERVSSILVKVKGHDTLSIHNNFYSINGRE